MKRMLLLVAVGSWVVGCGDSSPKNKVSTFVVDGVSHDTQWLEQSGWEDVHLYVDREAQANDFAYAFPTIDAVDAFLKTQPPPSYTGTMGIDQFDPTFWEYTYRSGGSFQLDDGSPEPDLSRMFCFLWFCQNWNNRISSLRSGIAYRVRLYDLQGNGGSSITFAPDLLVDDLGAWGWDNRASSIAFPLP